MRLISRRDAIGLGVFVAVAGHTAALASPVEAESEIARFSAGATPQTRNITIDLPEIAENGNSVPLAIAIDSPMTERDHVSEVLVVAERNPRPVVAKFQFTPMAGRAQASTRIRLASSQSIIVLAKTNSGVLFVSQRPVKVTIGGCGG